MIDYLDPRDVEELIGHGGFHFRDRTLFLFALAAPLPVFGHEVYSTVHEKAAALLIALNRNHPLLDGNKRLSWLVTTAFYEINGYDLAAKSVVEGDTFIRRVAAEAVGHDEVTHWLEQHTVKLDLSQDSP